MADEEGSQRLDVLRGLHGLAHGPDQMRERVQVVTNEPDHGVVVVRVLFVDSFGSRRAFCLSRRRIEADERIDNV